MRLADQIMQGETGKVNGKRGSRFDPQRVLPIRHIIQGGRIIGGGM